MKEALRRRIEMLAERSVEVGRLLAEPQVMNTPGQFRELSMEFSRLAPVAERWAAYTALETERVAAVAMGQDSDPEVRDMADDEVRAIDTRLAADGEELLGYLVPADPLDAHDVFLEIRAAAGGDEAAIFAGDLFRMYCKYADAQGWKVELLSESRGEHGGYKEVVSRVAGREVYSRLKFESGTHRVQRVPATEAQGRIHTSTCTVAVLPEQDEVQDVVLNEADLRVDTFRASGAGGQHVNKTDSAIRLTHLPTGLVVECQDERSQHKNRSRAMSLLKAKLQAAEREKREAATAQTRRLQVGTGDRSERIRTYNFPQGRLTDHRIELTLYKLQAIADGALDEVITPLSREWRAEQLAALGG